MLLKMLVAIERFELVNLKAATSELARGFVICASILSIWITYHLSQLSE